MTIFRKVISDKLSGGSSWYLYTHCRTNLDKFPVQTHTPQFVYIGLLAINALDEGSGIITPSNRIQRPMNGTHWSALNHICGETTAVGVSETNSDCNYNYKTEIQIWKENKEFENQKIPMI